MKSLKRKHFKKYNSVQLAVERAKVLAIVLKCHPAVLVFPGWDIGWDILHESAA